MKTNLLKMAAVFMAAASITACSKDKDSKSKTELLTKAAWKFDQGGIDGNADGTIDMPGSLEDCEKDNTATFNVNGTGTIDEGATKCDVADAQSTAFTWQFKNGESELEYDGDTYKVFSIDENQMKIFVEEQGFRILLILKH